MPCTFCKSQENVPKKRHYKADQCPLYLDYVENFGKEEAEVEKLKRADASRKKSDSNYNNKRKRQDASYYSDSGNEDFDAADNPTKSTATLSTELNELRNAHYKLLEAHDKTAFQVAHLFKMLTNVVSTFTAHRIARQDDGDADVEVVDTAVDSIAKSLQDFKF